MHLAAFLIAAGVLSACSATNPKVAATSPRVDPAMGSPTTSGPAASGGAVAALSSRPGSATTTLFVARRRWHIDVGFSVESLAPPLAATVSNFPRAHYLFFGFGDRRYLLSQDRGAPVLLAALWPGPALILVTALEVTPSQAFGGDQVAELSLAPRQALAVQEFIWKSLATNAGGGISNYATGPYDGSAYFAAVPRYSGLHTCITWAAEALRAGGLPIRSKLTLISGQLWRQVGKLRTPKVASHSEATRRLPQSRLSQSQGGGLPF